MSRPWLSIAARVKRSASAPYLSISPSGSTVLPLDLDIFWPVRVADQAVEVERLPRPLSHELEALHRHPRVPEEQDVEAGDEDVVRVMALEVLGLLGPARASRTATVLTRTRCRAHPRPAAAAGRQPALRASSSLSATKTLPSSAYQAGMRWPHQSWRETVHGWMFSSQLNQVFFHVSGTTAMSPDRTASIAGLARVAASTYHWSVSIGSITTFERSPNGCMIACPRP